MPAKNRGEIILSGRQDNLRKLEWIAELYQGFHDIYQFLVIYGGKDCLRVFLAQLPALNKGQFFNQLSYKFHSISCGVRLAARINTVKRSR
jgi:hypothetical protein